MTNKNSHYIVAITLKLVLHYLKYVTPAELEHGVSQWIEYSRIATLSQSVYSRRVYLDQI